MPTKRFLIMAYYGYDGWSIMAEADTTEEALAEYHNHYGYGEQLMIVAVVPLMLGEVPIFGKQDDEGE